MSTDPLIGQILLGKLEILGRLGGGGMGVVYEVEHRLTGHRRALKVVHSKFADRPRFMKRLLREAKVAGTLATEHVVETYDAGRLEDGSAYILMELLEGRSLYEALLADGPFAPHRLAQIMVQVAEAMSVAHAAGIIHRDLKPENIFLLAGEAGAELRVKVLDFGVSKFEDAAAAPTRLTADGTLVGTPYYMSPEQASGGELDARSDVYAMGVMMYEALSGRLPYEAASVGELFVRIGAGEHIPIETRVPELDARWVELVERAFARSPDDRHPSAEALRQDVLSLLDGGTSKARARTISDHPMPMTRGADVAPPPRDSGAELPGPIGAPDDDEAEEETPERPEDEAEAATPDANEASSPEPLAPPPEPRASATPGWVWALAGGAAVVLVIGLFTWARPPATDPAAADPTPRAAAAEAQAPTEEPSTEPPPAEPTAPPIAAIEPDAGGVSEPTTEAGSPTARRRSRTPSTPSGLDPNPYR